MLFARKKNTEEKTKLAEVIPFPTSRIVSSEKLKNSSSSYEELCKSLDFNPPDLVRFQLSKFFSDNEIKLFNYDEVYKYLSHKLLKEFPTGKNSKGKKVFWNWRTLRDKDSVNFIWGHDSNHKPAHDGYYDSKYESCKKYDLLIPQHALEKVQKIEEKLKDQVSFFVSDYDVPKPDPFIMVIPKKMFRDIKANIFIFDVWDEPGF